MEGRRVENATLSHGKGDFILLDARRWLILKPIQWELSTKRAKTMTADIAGALEHLRLALKLQKGFQRQQEDRKQEIEGLISSLRPLKKKYDGVVQKRAGSESP